MVVETIEEVIDRLGDIVDGAKGRGSPQGYFAALYRGVTVEVDRGIAAGDFDDGPRMERLDVRFANRYLDAYDALSAGGPVPDAWRLAFDTTRDWWPVVLQHLLLGMNAHINLDLGIAAARTAPAGELPGLRDDFNRINAILARLVDHVQDHLSEIWPLFRILDHTAARTDEATINFAMEKARDQAWRVAERLAPLALPDQGAVIARLDRDVAAFGGTVRRPGLWISSVLKVVRLGERGSVREKIEVLEGTPAVPSPPS